MDSPSQKKPPQKAPLQSQDAGEVRTADPPSFQPISSPSPAAPPVCSVPPLCNLPPLCSAPPVVAGHRAPLAAAGPPPLQVQLNAPAHLEAAARLRSRRRIAGLVWLAALGSVLAAATLIALSLHIGRHSEPIGPAAQVDQLDSAKPPAKRFLTIAPIDDQRVSPAGRLELVIEARFSDKPDSAVRYRLLRGEELGAQINPRTGRLVWMPAAVRAGGMYQFEVQAEEAVPGGLRATRTFNVHVLGASMPGEQAADGSPPCELKLPDDQLGNKRSGVAHQPAPQSPPDNADETRQQPPPDMPKPKKELAAEETADAAAERTLVELYQSKKLLARSAYDTIRKIYAGRFERQYEDEIRRGLGDDYQKVMAWLDANRVFKEELFTAIDPQHDDIAAALRIVARLIDKYPSKVLQYGELAIAVAVVWDQRRGVYDYSGHRSRAKALESPEPPLEAVENFQYLLDAEKLMQGRGQYLPWEFLIHVVDHRTPEAERRWALSNYLPRRAMIGACYRDVPYDYDLLDRNQPRLAGQQYTLANLRTFGGVCAMQADFAARVAKSLGVPAAYVHGEAIQGDRHAWVMWVEVKSVTRDNIVFSLESHGRYRGDKYYVGHLHDPQTAQRITDRQLELRLHTVGIGPLAKRQAALVMRSYPMLHQKLAMDVETQLAFLNQVISLCPGNEEAWRAAARLSKEGQITESRQIKQIMQLIDRLFITFAAMPDFTWELFDDLVSFQNNRKQFLSYYDRLVTLYQQASRPDLACEARLKHTEHLVADGKHREAIEGLAFTIKAFPEEGRYVPRMLDRLEEVCKQVKGAEEHLVRLYQELLPAIPPERNGRPSKYYMSMLERAAARFTQYNRPELGQACQAQLARLRALEAQRKNPATQ